MPGKIENGPSEATRAIDIRQSKSSMLAPSGETTISVVSPPPFFHGMVRNSLARNICISQGSAD
jgi:hypothetical protein